ncbi:glycosyltransferase family 39 protein [Pusillimonas sp. CC-YST705]|uniref:Glycosyltransferase family 39 protein n=2 Tax=Mesopusillimonas faecipullorum TaxID=2755040 RepID=A0ABS8C8M0_9BURK|nr:glycosyltransferase family 39 protein [Mesopusillimonas faecipullorum]
MRLGASANDPALPVWLLPALLCGMVLLWAGLVGVTHQAPDLDGMEELVWASSFEWGYYKHPPLPTWFLYPLTWLFGKPVWLPFLAAQVLTALALWFIWRLGCEWTTPARSLIAVLALSTTAYFSMRGTIYNHNTAQLWSVAAATWFYYRALKYERLSSWLALGLLVGLAFLTKYSVVVQLAAFALFALRQGYWRRPSFWKGACLAAVLFLLVVTPHLIWLVQSDFAPLAYLESRSAEDMGLGKRLAEIWGFLSDQLARNSPLLVAWLALAWWNRRTGNRSANSYAHDLADWDKSFLLWVGLGPLGLTVLVALLTGSVLAASWATTFFILYGFFIFWWLSGDVRLNLRRMLVLVVGLHVLMAVAYSVARGPVAYQLGRDSRPTFPGPQLAAQMHALWQEHVPGTPLRLVAAETWLGGNIAVHVSPQTQVFIDANFQKSPWLDPATTLECGALVVYDNNEDFVAEDLILLRGHSAWSGVVQQRWSSEKSPMLEIAWGILPPTERCLVAQ